MQEETQLPVFFAAETPQLLDIYREVKTSLNSDQADSAAEGDYLGGWDHLKMCKFQVGGYKSDLPSLTG